MHHPSVLSLAAFCALLAPDLRALQRAPEPCDRYRAAVAADPNNLEAAARLGRCSVQDYEMIAPGGDSSRLVFRSSWSEALRALRHAVELDRTYTAAYGPLFTILFAEERDGCSSVTGECGYVSPVLRDGDSVITAPRSAKTSDPGRSGFEEAARESQTTRRANLNEARLLAERWASAAPNDRRPHEYLGKALLRLGDPAAATTELEYAATLGTAPSRRAIFWDRIEAFIRTDRGSDARRVLEEIASDPGRDTMQLRSYALAHLNSFLGRHRPAPPDTSPRMRALRAQGQARRDSTFQNLRNVPRRPGFSALLAAGDTVDARRELARMDSLWPPVERPGRFPLVNEITLQSATFHLALGDTAAAEQRLAQIERGLTDRRFPEFLGLVFDGGRPWLGRAWFLSGDLAVARGRPGEAMRMFRRVIGLWGGGDPEVQPLVDQARARLDALFPR